MKCKYCGRPAGFLKKEHPECIETIANGKKYIRECIDYIYSNRNCMNIKEVITDTVKRYMIPVPAVKPLLIECWEEKIEDAFNDGVIEDHEIKILREMLLPLDITFKEIQNSSQGMKLLEYGQEAIRKIINSAIKNRNLSSLAVKVDKIAEAYGLGSDTVKKNIMICWKAFLDEALEDGFLNEDDENFLKAIGDVFLFCKDDIAAYNETIVKGAVMRDILSGTIPDRLNITNQLPVMLQKQESVIWLFNNVKAYEDKTTRRYDVERVVTLYLGCSDLIITNKHIFWASTGKSLKLPIKKIVSIIPYAKGIIIQKDGVTARPYTFLTDDPRFTYNLISNLNLIQ